MKNNPKIEIGKIYVDKQGAGRLYIPKTIIAHLQLQNKEHIKLEANKNTLTAKSIEKI